LEPIRDIADGRERDAGTIVALAQQVLQEREQLAVRKRDAWHARCVKANAISGRWEVKGEK
jgi:hypothetical protein